jgi:capsular polysaccharide biosynthesis protein
MYRVLMSVGLIAMAVTLASSTRTPTYEASAQVRVDLKQGDQQTYLTRSGEEIQPLPPPGQLQELTQVMTYAIDSHPVAKEVIRRLGLRMAPAELLDNLTVEQVENKSFVVLTYEGTNPVEATQIVNTVGVVSSELISEKTTPARNLRAIVYEKAIVPESPVSPNPLRNGLLTLVIGLLLCLSMHHLHGRAAGYSS